MSNEGNFYMEREWRFARWAGVQVRRRRRGHHSELMIRDM